MVVIDAEALLPFAYFDVNTCFGCFNGQLNNKIFKIKFDDGGIERKYSVWAGNMKYFY